MSLFGTIGGLANSFAGASESTAVCPVTNCDFPNSGYYNENPLNPELYRQVYSRALVLNCTGSDPTWNSYGCAWSHWSRQFLGNAVGEFLGPGDTYYADPDTAYMAAVVGQVAKNTSTLDTGRFWGGLAAVSAFPGAVGGGVSSGAYASANVWIISTIATADAYGLPATSGAAWLSRMAVWQWTRPGVATVLANYWNIAKSVSCQQFNRGC